jgi:SAM-dependent methyltransferase
MQNVVYDLPCLAKSCASGTLILATCQQCGHTFNNSFDPSFVVYDQNYNNTVPSVVMDRYYDAIGDYLYEKYDLTNGTVVDVGCGKGIFLQQLGKNHADVCCLGIDPSYESSPGLDPAHNITFVRDIFRPNHLESRPSLIVCRHVLEHISDLPRFLGEIRSTLSSWPEVPFFVEVPDLNWIVNHRAFWDFCYEHCNYFTEDSVRECLGQNGFEVNKVTSAFGGQYLWIEGFVSQGEPAKQRGAVPTALSTTQKLQAYFAREQEEIDRARAFLVQKRRERRHVVIWGMATKGVLFNFLIDPDSVLVDQCVDINRDKQGKFLPVLGKLIQAPQTIAASSLNPIIVVMNPNYKSEITALCESFGLQAEIYDISQL